MKALIVDDERHVVDAIQLLVPWRDLGITEIFTACSVPEACDILDAEQPDIAIVDVVIEDRLGMEVLAHINTQQMATKSLVISGHDNYQYLRAMFMLGSVDYLLKPIVPEEIVDAVRKAVEQVQQAAPKGRRGFGVDRQIKQLFPDHQHSLFRKLFQNDLRSAAYRELCQTNRHVQEAQNCLVLNATGLFLPIHDEDYVIELSSFLNGLQRHLENTNSGTLFQQNQPTPDVVILLYHDFDAALQYIREACMQFNREHGSWFYLGCSAYQPFADGIEEAWSQARTASDQFPLYVSHPVLEYTADQQLIRVPYHLQEENRFFSALLVGQKESFDEALDQWMDSMLSKLTRCRGSLRCLWDAFLSLHEKWSNYFAIPDENLPYNALAALYHYDWDKTVAELREYFRQKLWNLHLVHVENRSTGSWTREVADYLELNYAKKFHQQECADLFHLNKDYMCRHFKEVYGVGMVNYLNAIRIRKAKELLLHTNLQVQEIADRVGYFDNKYFSRQFKKETGQTPAEFRSGQPRPEQEA